MAYQVVYWPGFTGRAEPVLLLLEDAGQAYELIEDVPGSLERFSRNAPVFACPLLIDGDTVLSQTNVIVEYLGTKHGYEVPSKGRIAAAQLAYNAADIWSEVYDQRRLGNAEFLQERLPRWLLVLENSFNAESGDYFFGDKPSFVDFVVLNAMTLAEYCWGDTATALTGEQPRLRAWLKRMKDRPRLKAYFENPQSLPVGYEEVSAATL